MRAIKQPSEKLTFVYDFSDDVDGATVTLTGTPVGGTPSSVARGTGANITIDGVATVQANVVLVRWQGGVDGESYLTTVRMVDSAGDIHERDGEIYVVEKSFAVPASASSRYLSADDYVARYGTQETIRLTDEDKTGVVDKGKIEAALKDATEEADAYIGKRYTTPLLSTPRIVAAIVGALAREKLHKTRPTPEVVAAADRARSQLLDISAGRMILPVEQGDSEPVIGGNSMAQTSGDGTTTFKDAVSGFNLCPGAPVGNWRL
jgi:phage gp36-like protein